jgi:hypothetical protein
MKKIFMPFIMATALFACSTSGDTASGTASATAATDEATMNDFKENSKTTRAIFEAFSNKDLNTWDTYNADTLKAHGPMYGAEATVGKAVLRQRLSDFHKLFENIKANDIMLLPGVDTITFKPNGDVRAYVRWTSDIPGNGKKNQHKYYSVIKFNKDHKLIDVDEYFDASGVIKNATSPK